MEALVLEEKGKISIREVGITETMGPDVGHRLARGRSGDQIFQWG
mgnify:CR=1 FL=1